MADATTITTGNLIAAEKVTGTNVYNRAGEHLGSIEDIMMDKVSGRAIYAVMSFGGFLGVGESHYPLPWRKLKYVVARHGFVVDISKEKLARAPKYERESLPIYDPAYGTLVDGYYGLGR